MPNPLFLKAMGVPLSEYNTYSDEKKARFQRAATKKLAEVSNDPAAYTDLTNATENPETDADTKSEWENE
jgi:hypothetical protein